MRLLSEVLNDRFDYWLKTLNKHSDVTWSIEVDDVYRQFKIYRKNDVIINSVPQHVYISNYQKVKPQEACIILYILQELSF